MAFGYIRRVIHAVQLNSHIGCVVTRCHDHGGGLCQAAEYAVGLAQAVDGSDAASEGERSRRYILVCGERVF